MSRQGIKIDGLPEVHQLLAQVAPREARNLNRAAIHAVAGEIRDEAKVRAPVDTRTLKRALKAIRRRPRDPDKPFSDVRVEEGTSARHDAWYWHFLEYGTVKQPARPFIGPAIADIRPRIVGVYKKHFGAKLEASLRRKARKQRRG